MRRKVQLFASLLLICDFLPFTCNAENCTYNCTEEEIALTANIMRGLDTGPPPSNSEQASEQEWSTTDTVVEAATYGVMYADYKQTVEIAKNDTPGRDYSERNPLLPRHPSIGRVNSIFILAALSHPVISYALPQPFRAVWQYTYISLEGYCIYINHRIGLNF